MERAEHVEVDVVDADDVGRATDLEDAERIHVDLGTGERAVQELVFSVSAVELAAVAADREEPVELVHAAALLKERVGLHADEFRPGDVQGSAGEADGRGVGPQTGACVEGLDRGGAGDLKVAALGERTDGEAAGGESSAAERVRAGAERGCDVEVAGDVDGGALVLERTGAGNTEPTLAERLADLDGCRVEGRRAADRVRAVAAGVAAEGKRARGVDTGGVVEDAGCAVADDERAGDVERRVRAGQVVGFP